VTAPPGPSLVIAGAGSGKTRTLTYRVAFLLEQGIPPECILLLTFTNKAAKEMMRRVTDLLGQELASLWGGTFHSIGNRILRQHANLVGYGRDFSIMDREDARHLINTCIGESEIDAAAMRFPKADVLGEIFSLCVNTEHTVEQVLAEQYSVYLDWAREIADLHGRYTERKRSSNSMDFDDLLALWLKLLQDQAEVREQYQRRFQFILVDEYQDTNKLQSELIDLLAARHKNVMVVGDDAQSIYAWRGANYENILKFPQRYPGVKIYKIETNYRSTPEILQVANAAISANIHQFTKKLAPARKGGNKPIVVACGDAGQQAAFVAQRVLELREEGIDLKNMAVLYRSHFHALELQLELTRRNIPFSITSGIRFFEQAHIKDAIAYLKLVSNPRDEISFKRLVQLLPGVGPKAADKLWRALAAPPVAPAPIGSGALPTPEPDRLAVTAAAADGGEAPNGPGPRVASRVAAPEDGRTPPETGSSSPRCAMKLQLCAPVVPKKAGVAWAQFVATIAQLEGKEVRENPAKMLRLILEAGYEDHLKRFYTNYESRLDDVEQIAVFAQQFPSVEEFLTQLALLTNIEAEEEQPVQTDDEQLRLSTIHQAKGLEFDVVFLIMLCEGLFPSSRSLKHPDATEEERRLMYVAITRARNELYLTYPLVRAGFGEMGNTMQRESRFLSEIPTDLVEEWDLKPYA